MTRKSLQKGLIFLAIREVESNATLRLSLTPFRMDIIKSESENKYWHNMGKWEPLDTVGGGTT